jgi:hypothetical protein
MTSIGVIQPRTGVTRGLDLRVHLFRNELLRRKWIAGVKAGNDNTPLYCAG